MEYLIFTKQTSNKPTKKGSSNQWPAGRHISDITLAAQMLSTCCGDWIETRRETLERQRKERKAMKAYNVMGVLAILYIERDEWGDVVRADRSIKTVSVSIVSGDPESAAEMARQTWAWQNNWPADCVTWAYGPVVVLAPEDQQMRLAGAPMLPGLGER